MSSFFPRGEAIDGFKFGIVDKRTGDPVTTGVPTLYISKDLGAQAPTTNAAVHVGNGEWRVNITALERDAKITTLTVIHADGVPGYFPIVSDDQLGPGALACLIQLGSFGALADVWVTLTIDNNNVIASGQADISGNITFYLDAGTYNIYRQKPLVDFDPNPSMISVSAAGTFDLSAYTSASVSTLELQTLATLADAEDYFESRLNTDAWDNASDSNKLKGLAQATRAINRLAFIGDPTNDALTAGNQFPRGDDIEIPMEVKWAVCEETLSLLNGNDPSENTTNVLSERFSGAAITYDLDNVPDNVHSGITSAEAWRFLKPFLRDRRSPRLVRT